MNHAWHIDQQNRLRGVFFANYGPYWADVMQRLYGGSTFRYESIVNSLGDQCPCDGITSRLAWVVLTMQTAHYGWSDKSVLQSLDAAMTAFRNTDGVREDLWSMHFANGYVILRYQEGKHQFEIIAPPAIGLCHAIAYSFYRYLFAAELGGVTSPEPLGVKSE